MLLARALKGFVVAQKNKLAFDLDGEIIETTFKEVDPREYPSWYTQFFSLDSSKRKKTINSLLENIKKEQPEAYQFIKKFDCKLVGVQPRVEYALINSSEGDTTCTWIHAFSMATLLFWCEAGSFGLFINPVLHYDDSVLNKIPGNKKQNIRGFTG